MPRKKRITLEPKNRADIGVVSAHTNQNYNTDEFETNENNIRILKSLLTSFNVSLFDIKTTHKEVSIISFNSQKMTNKEMKKRVVLAVEKMENEECFREDINSEKQEYKYIVRTGLYVGLITIKDAKKAKKGLTFYIKPDCSDALFEQMLNYANHIYIDKNEEKGRAKNNIFPLIEYLFLSSLQRVSVLGLPQEYSKQKYHDLKVHGGLDVQNFIKKDIPFMGRISSQKNERLYVQCIVDVLYTALKMCRSEIERNFKRLNLIKNELSAAYSGRLPSQQTILNAQMHRVLSNPMFADFKQTLKFAEIVIKHNTILPDAKDDAKMTGYLLDVSSLWEVYLEDVLRRVDGWSVVPQQSLELYSGCFFERENRPDFVLQKKDGSCMAVLDAKFKKMDGTYSDVDREDLFQIHSYAGYYREKGVENVKCGLIYPLSNIFYDRVKYDDAKSDDDSKKAERVSTLYGLKESKNKFTIDGIYKYPKDGTEVAAEEDRFVKSITKFLA